MTVSERLDASLERIAALNARFCAFATVDRDGARQAALAADAALRDGRWRGVLQGMLIGVKDNIDTAGLRTACGSALFADRVPNADAPVVQRLRDAGAIIVGKTALMELCFGVRSTDMIAGQVRNPWDEQRVPGGSSGGSAAAVALDFCQGALGSDTGGSVRVPAAFCGVTGLRPTHGRIPNRGSLPVSAALDTIGPLARNVDDVARLFVAMAGVDPLDATSVDAPLPASLLTGAADVAGLRIGLPRSFYFDDVDQEVADAVHRFSATLAAAGAVIVEVDLPGAELAHHHASTIILSDACEVHADALDHRQGAFSTEIYQRMSKGRLLSGVDYARAMRFREEWRRTLRQMFLHADVLLIPSTPFAAPPIDDGVHLEDSTRHATRFTYGGALAGIPGLSLPCGMTRGGLPIGVLLESAWFNEALLLRAGRFWQRTTDWHQRRPSSLSDFPGGWDGERSADGEFHPVQPRPVVPVAT